MKILYRGKWTPPEYKFECDRCGSVWECGGNEVQRVVDRNEMYISCVCPICGERVTQYECRCVGITKSVDK